MHADAALRPPAVATDASLRDAEDVARALGTDLDAGLTSAQAAQRLAADGPNTLRASAPVPAWRRWLAQFQDPLVVLLLVAVSIALTAWAVEGFAGWPVDALVIAAVLVLNAAIGHAQQSRARSAVAALARMTAVTATVVRDARVQRVPSEQLVRGDLLLLAEGDAVGADARLIAANTLRVQEASLTGESEAVRKDAAALTAPAPLAERIGMVFKGTAVVSGTGRAVVTATGMATQMGAVASLLETTVEEPTPL